jgi:hypothetical protein
MTNTHVSEKRQALLDITRDNNNNLHDYDVVETASDPDHVLHDEFDWDDSSAGHKHRLAQAQNLIKRYKVVIEKAEPAGPPRRYKVALFSKDDQSNNGGYAITTDMIADPVRAQTLLARLKSKALTLKTDIEAYQAVADLLAETDDPWVIVSKAIDDAVKPPVGV